MKEIELTGTDKKTVVDDEWFDILNKHKWQYHSKTGYVYRTTTAGRHPDGRLKVKAFYMARVVMGVEWKTRFEIEVDHIDRNKLNNQRSNLRLANRTQNIVNRPAKPGSAARFKGVTTVLHADGTMIYKARIRYRNKDMTIGNFSNEEAAAMAYDSKAFEYHGEFAYLNFPERISK